MVHVPEDFYDSGGSEEIYKILRKSEVGNQHITVPDDGRVYPHYRPICHGNLPMFTIGSATHDNPSPVDDIMSVMTLGVIEGPVQGTAPALGETVYCAYTDLEGWYLTTDETDSDIECCWGIIIDNQAPIHYGETVLTGDYALLYNVRIIPPACGDISGRQPM